MVGVRLAHRPFRCVRIFFKFLADVINELIAAFRAVGQADVAFMIKPVLDLVINSWVFGAGFSGLNGLRARGGRGARTLSPDGAPFISPIAFPSSSPSVSPKPNTSDMWYSPISNFFNT